MLKKALLGNAVFSFLSAAVMFLFSDWLSAQLLLSQADWFSLGSALGVFSFLLLLLAANQGLAQKLTMSVVAGDVLWVLITSVLFVTYLKELSEVGLLLIAAVNLIVGSLAFLQYKGHHVLSVS
jgi:hypothetical protein